MQKRRRTSTVVLAAIVLLTAGCTGTQPNARRPSSSSTSGVPATQACPITPPTSSTVPASVAKQVTDGVFGHGNLWLRAWWDNPQSLEQVRSKDLGDSKYPYQEKYPTWTLKDGTVTDTAGAPRVTVKAVNGHGRGTGTTGGYASAGLDDGTTANWWPTGVSFPTVGCWQVTESVSNETISYIVQI